MKRFVYLHKDGTPSSPKALPIVMSVAALRVLPGRGPFRLYQNEDEGPPRSRVEVLRRLRAALRHGDVGDVYQVRDRDKRPVFRVRESKPYLKVIDTNGNAKADRAWTAAVANAKAGVFANVTFLGAYVCKLIIGGGGVRSQHSYGNALDIGAPTMADLYRIAHWYVDRADEFDLEHVIVDDRVWTRGIGWHHYTGERHYHVHLDFNPQLSGQCGVREAA